MPRVIKLRLATCADDAAVRKLLRETPMPGSLSMSVLHEPSFFAALETEGHSPQFVVVENERGELRGMGGLITKKLFVNGREKELGYLSGLRFAPELRKASGLARGFRMLRELLADGKDMPKGFLLTSILAENRLAREILTSGRGGLPAYRELLRCRTLSYPAFLAPLHEPRPPRGLKLRRASELGYGKLTDFLMEHGAKKQFFPVYEGSAFNTEARLLRGLALNDVLLATDGKTIRGSLACWNQRAFKQRLINSYSGTLNLARIPANLLGKLRGAQTPLPAPGKELGLLMASAVLAKDDDPVIFESLLSWARHETLHRGAAWLSLGLAERDPLMQVARRPFHSSLESIIYAVCFDETAEAELRRLDTRPPYLEIASL